MSARSKSGGNSETSRLMQEGARSYLDALVAMSAFRHEIFRRCRSVVESQIAALRDTHGESLTIDVFEDREWPSRGAWDQTEATVGVRIKIPLPPKSHFSLSLGLAWYAGGETPWFGVYTGIWAPPKRAVRLLKKLQQAQLSKKVELGHYAGEVWISRELNVEQASDFETTLDEITAEWVRIGKKVGGIHKILADES